MPTRQPAAVPVPVPVPVPMAPPSTSTSSRLPRPRSTVALRTISSSSSSSLSRATAQTASGHSTQTTTSSTRPAAVSSHPHNRLRTQVSKTHLTAISRKPSASNITAVSKLNANANPKPNSSISTNGKTNASTTESVSRAQRPPHHVSATTRPVSPSSPSPSQRRKSASKPSPPAPPLRSHHKPSKPSPRPSPPSKPPVTRPSPSVSTRPLASRPSPPRANTTTVTSTTTTTTTATAPLADPTSALTSKTALTRVRSLLIPRPKTTNPSRPLNPKRTVSGSSASTTSRSGLGPGPVRPAVLPSIRATRGNSDNGARQNDGIESSLDCGTGQGAGPVDPVVQLHGLHEPDRSHSLSSPTTHVTIFPPFPPSISSPSSPRSPATASGPHLYTSHLPSSPPSLTATGSHIPLFTPSSPSPSDLSLSPSPSPSPSSSPSHSPARSRSGKVRAPVDLGQSFQLRPPPRPAPSLPTGRDDSTPTPLSHSLSSVNRGDRHDPKSQPESEVHSQAEANSRQPLPFQLGSPRRTYHGVDDLRIPRTEPTYFSTPSKLTLGPADTPWLPRIQATTVRTDRESLEMIKDVELSLETVSLGSDTPAPSDIGEGEDRTSRVGRTSGGSPVDHRFRPVKSRIGDLSDTEGDLDLDPSNNLLTAHTDSKTSTDLALLRSQITHLRAHSRALETRLASSLVETDTLRSLFDVTERARVRGEGEVLDLQRELRETVEMQEEMKREMKREWQRELTKERERSVWEELVRACEEALKSEESERRERELVRRFYALG